MMPKITFGEIRKFISRIDRISVCKEYLFGKCLEIMLSEKPRTDI